MSLDGEKIQESYVHDIWPRIGEDYSAQSTTDLHQMNGLGVYKSHFKGRTWDATIYHQSSLVSHSFTLKRAILLDSVENPKRKKKGKALARDYY